MTLPSDKRANGFKWVYKIKYQADGTLERFRVRLVAKGYRRQEGLNYQEIFSPVFKMVSVRAMISLAATRK